MQTLFNFIYLLSVVCWLGSIIFFSFIGAPGIFKTLEREKAGEVAGVIFPKILYAWLYLRRTFVGGFGCGLREGSHDPDNSFIGNGDLFFDSWNGYWTKSKSNEGQNKKRNGEW